MIDFPYSTWQSVASAAQQLSNSSPSYSLTLFKMAIAECRQSLGPNSEPLANLYEEAARVCTRLDLVVESRRYQNMATQIREFNGPKKLLKNSGLI